MRLMLIRTVNPFRPKHLEIFLALQTLMAHAAGLHADTCFNGTDFYGYLEAWLKQTVEFY